MIHKEIKTREDIHLLVTTFYDKVKIDPVIGAFFTETIPEESWDTHLIKITDFWETNLLFVKRFKGNPIAAHKNLDVKFNNQITQVHFGKWLELWIVTVDALFTGEKAILAKERAKNIGFMLFLRIFEARGLSK
ncbi:group III truncated hemoglobin [uncultured Polaribacter sp.]|uniref:group III truncated hemoglobin n=1 Tax=uncultured Polaribacter sp. TaxID=174711 RepID=UPI00262F9D56|nr:group III truncated hemoglobin [uncultured Polaribacter sp.]